MGSSPGDDGDNGDAEDKEHHHASFADYKDQQGRENGTLVYSDPSVGLKLRSSNGVRAITYSGRCVNFIGAAVVNETPGYQFNFNACDLGQPAIGVDTFSITVTGPAAYKYQTSSTLSSGFIHVHPH
jgi:hypothetical protein